MRLILLFFFMMFSVCSAGVIFETNFDDDPTTFRVDTDICDYEDTPRSDIPNGFTGYYTASVWVVADGYEPAIEITDEVYKGSSGHSYRVWNESRFGSSGYGGDGIIIKLFDRDYQEIYYRLSLRSQDGWQYTDYELTKMFRIMHFDRTGSFFSYFSTGNLCPMSVHTFKYSSTYGIRTNNDTTYRCDPQDSDYACGGLSDMGDILWPGASGKVPTDEGMLMDGEWHTFDIHVKMNTYSDGSWNTDGIYELEVDGVSHVSRSDVNWKRDGSTESVGWNAVEFGGNSYNTYDDGESYGEQWYAIDDIVVSTTAIPPDYVIGVESSTLTGLKSLTGGTIQ